MNPEPNIWLPEDSLITVTEAGDALVIGLAEAHHPAPLVSEVLPRGGGGGVLSVLELPPSCPVLVPPLVPLTTTGTY